MNLKNYTFLYILIFTLLYSHHSLGFQRGNIVFTEQGADRFPLVSSETAAGLVIDADEPEGVKIAAANLQLDIEKVTGKKPTLEEKVNIKGSAPLVIIGTIGKSKLIDRLISTGKIKGSELGGKWETYLIQTVENPFDGIPEALVIAGSDKRGTTFGIYELSEQIGVSPWYWWADVPVQKKDQLYISQGKHTKGTPAVKYRGIFINDEAPALAGWAEENFGGFNHQFYEKVFELILRLKGNYLWPAMWGRAIYDDDPISPILADKYGVVIGTSHHEPLMRAHVEWSRYGTGDWNYESNAPVLQEFWKEGIKRMGDNESIVTLGMRGDGDEPMSEESNIQLLERIVADQRGIIEEVTGKPASETPQVWALYKEVQDYYDQGMRVPDDVTLLLADDNWGNVRKLPGLGEAPRPGGYGMYYHFDYVGGPRNYKWLNTSPISRIWEQMKLTYEHGVDELWIVNVGDIKPMELPITFFLDYAWNPNNYPEDRMGYYTEEWAVRQFGPEFAPEIAHLLDKYTKYNGRRKPELLDQHTYSLHHYNEAERVVKEYNELVELAEGLYENLDNKYKDAYYQLVLHPVIACANLNELYLTVANNHLYEKQGRNLTNYTAEKVKELFERDAELSRIYNEELADGKWNHMMDQTHIGYTYWQQPEENVMPEVKTKRPNRRPALGVALSGSENFFPAQNNLTFQTLTPYMTTDHYLEIFNRGEGRLQYSIHSEDPFIGLSTNEGNTSDQERIYLKVNWENVPIGQKTSRITVHSGREKVTVEIPLHHMVIPEGFTGFVESGGYISIEAANFTGKKETMPFRWITVPDLGRTGSAVTLSRQVKSDEEMVNYLEYTIYVETPGMITLHTYLSPTLNYLNLPEGIRFGVSIGGETPQVISMHTNSGEGDWNKWVANNINVVESEHKIATKGEHKVRIYFVDPGIVLQKLVINTGSVDESYLGPPESYFKARE
ncbi:glycosyl hydrolase 115 family protein [Anditalea andensis]|uniref:Glycosyl hydrolase n=1 Tax=Anditalea andensis TaxID=1048983 RepID=A0A074L7D5_9BACT|nr:glycosyl hydrolase 115 family protein [Anditalea andensis]KEO75763.1 glycosyl hydrolase [Anditalea andensis]